MESTLKRSQITNYNDSQTDFAKNFRRLRACARCHRLKMKCTFEDPSFQSCTRCFKAGLRCSVTDDPTLADAKPRPRKRTKLKGNSALAQLQKSINDSNKLFNGIQRGEIISNDTNIEDLQTLQFQLGETQRLLLHTINTLKEKGKETGSGDDDASNKHIEKEANSINSMKDGTVKSIPNLPWISCESNIMKELIKMNIITSSEAKERMDRFFTELHIYWPCVSFPKHYTYKWLLDNEPLVLLSFITVTCLNDPDLHDTLLYYLEDNLSVRTSIIGNISVSFIQIHLVLSLWCSPPKKWGSYKHQMSLLMALNLTLCLDLGNEVYKNSSNILSDDSMERQMIRSYMAVYACCGSLGLSLPRFKVVSWTPVHERCCQLLLSGESNQADKFLYYYSKLVALGEEIFQFLCPNGFPNQSVRRSSNNNDNSDEKDFPVNNSKLKDIMVGYEKRMQKIAMDSNLFNSSSSMRNLLSIIYYQLLMTMYDYIVCKVLLRRDVLTEVYIETLSRLIKASEKVISSFCALDEQTSEFPTFFYYRPMHALVALIRARLLIKTQELDLEVNVEEEHEKVVKSIEKLSKNSKVASKMGMILTRISKWMKVSNKFNKNGATNSMVDLLNELGREKAIENIKINLKNNKNDSGDNMNMSNESKINFKTIVNYNADGMKGGHLFTTKNFTPMKRSDISFNSENNDPNNSVNSIFIPSPIGFSEIDDVTQNILKSSRKSSVLINDTLGFDNSKKIPSTIEEFNTKNFFDSSRNSSISQVRYDEGYINSKQKSQSPINAGINTNLLSSNGITDTPISNGVVFEQQQQELLNDLFSQIDTDIMNMNNNSSFEGITPMFDFLGTGFQNFNGNGNNEYPTTDDWFKNL